MKTINKLLMVTMVAFIASCTPSDDLPAPASTSIMTTPVNTPGQYEGESIVGQWQSYYNISPSGVKSTGLVWTYTYTAFATYYSNSGTTSDWNGTFTLNGNNVIHNYTNASGATVNSTSTYTVFSNGDSLSLTNTSDGWVTVHYRLN